MPDHRGNAGRLTDIYLSVAQRTMLGWRVILRLEALCRAAVGPSAVDGSGVNIGLKRTTVVMPASSFDSKWFESMQSLHRLKCADTWASNQSGSSVAQLPGLRVWIHSKVFGASHAGDDVHYISVCPSCIVSRVALADVSGHGFAVESMGIKLRALMQKYLAALDQTHLMRDLNEAVRQDFDGIHYATMVAVGFHGRRGLLVLTNAGHPPPLWYRANRGDWEWVEPLRAEPGSGIRGTPLGLLPAVSYRRIILKPTPGDLIVLYSDGITEATNSDGKELGRDQLMTMARALNSGTAETFGVRLVDAVNEFRGGRAPEDDETIIVLQSFPERSR